MILPVQPGQPSIPERANPQLWQAAQAFEAQFLSEMLAAAGLGEARSQFGGGPGEELFSSHLRQAQAEEMARAGGLGLAESIYAAMLARSDG